MEGFLSTEFIECIRKLRSYIAYNLAAENVPKDMLVVLPELMNMNNLGFITFDAQPYINDFHLVKRSYVNGLYPRKFVGKLATQLFAINNKIIISETVFRPKPDDDYINLYNYHNTRISLIDGLYPMAYRISNSTKQWLVSVSGNIIYPMNRDYIMEYFPNESTDIIDTLVDEYSLVQIWSSNISDQIFFPIIGVLTNIY